MPLKKTHNKYVILPNFDFRHKYWPILSKLVFDEIGNDEIKNQDEVLEILKKCFSKLCEIFQERINAETRVSFYIFCHSIHEDSIELFQLQTQKIPLEINEEDFAASRRILKIVLEQSTKLDLKGTPNFLLEINKNIKEYISILEELIYLGYWCYTLSEIIARAQLFENSIGIQIVKNELNILTYQPYPELFKFIFNEIPKHDSNVVLADTIDEFKNIIHNHYGVEYNDLSSFILQLIEKPQNKFSLSKIDPLIIELQTKLNCNKDFIVDFYLGLTVRKENCLSVEKCFYNNQDENRYTFRPILELNVDNEKYNLIGYHKWLESFTLLTTNSFPFGLYPNEWRKYNEIKVFIQKIDNSHDKILENPIIEILESKAIFYDNNIESFFRPNGQNINIKNDIGDIDILFIDNQNSQIYICECKHNRSRFDNNNWKRDYTNFKKSYENQLNRKVEWAINNKEIIDVHLKNKYGDLYTESVANYDVIGIFIINAPTIYMFNGQYRALTIKDFIDLISGNYLDVKFQFTNEKTGEVILIEHPYFDDLKAKLK